MISTTETGHGKNVANFLQFNSFLSTLGAQYNPAFAVITLPSLVNIQSIADSKLQVVRNGIKTWQSDTNSREVAVSTMEKFSTRLLGVLKSTDTPQLAIDDLASLVRKMHGNTKKKKTPLAKATTATDPAPEVERTRSSSQQSYDKKIETFASIITHLQGTPTYITNEPDLQIPALQAMLANLVTLNANVANSHAILKAARIDRDNFFYAPGTGMLDIIKKAKAYVLGIYGKQSPQYITASSHHFVRPR